jgi:hypothetical protein
MDRKSMRIRSTLITLLAAGSLVAGCHKAPEQPPENQAVETPKPVAPAPKPAPVPEKPAKPAKPVAAKVKAAPEPTADQQMIDDAEATGMTSHASHDDEASGSAGNSQQ